MVRETSIETYNEIKRDGLLSMRRQQVYDVIYEHGPITISQILQHLVKYTRNTGSFTGRISELERMQAIRSIKEGTCPITGRNVNFWITTNNRPKEIKKKPKQACLFCNGTGFVDSDLD